MVLAADFALGEALWTMFVFFLWVIWFMLLFHVFADLFRDHETSGAAKALWTIFLVLTPYLGVFVYILVRGGGMAERSMAQQRAAKAEFDAYVREAGGGGGPAGEIAHAKKLLDDGAINQEEFEQLKRKAMT
jgi:hypothetical protein